MNKILKQYSDIFYKKNLYFLGSASTSFYTFIKHKEIENSKILCPSNICYSIPYTILGTSNKALFYDVEAESGNASFESIRSILEKNEDIGAILLPHLFGNPIKDRDRIVKLCRARGLVIVDDCAGSLGLEKIDESIKKTSDAVIFSFASNKHVSMGKGGVLGTDEEVDVEKIGRSIVNDYKVHRYKIEMLDRLYKPLFYSKDYYNLIKNLSTFNDFFADSHVYRFVPDESYKTSLAAKLDDFTSNREYRHHIKRYIDERIDFRKEHFTQYVYSEGYNPWRYNLLVEEPSLRSRIIKILLEEGIPVSIWYPPIDPIFGCDAQPESTRFSTRILNFDFINASQMQIDRFIEIINSN